MEGGHRRHGLNQQEDTEAKGTDTALGGAHQPSGGRWPHERECGTIAVTCQQFLSLADAAATEGRDGSPSRPQLIRVRTDASARRPYPSPACTDAILHSPMILTSTRLRRPPSNSP
jgi:hypothetical protein